jgi:hypothetical protein
LITTLALLVVAGALVWAGRHVVAIAAEAAAAKGEAKRTRELTILSLFAPAIAAATADPRSIIVWQPVAQAARALFPDEFGAIDRALGTAFPFSRERLEAAHAQWTADWLAWERSHDSGYKRRAAEAERQLALAPSPDARATLESIESEKLALYQRRYEEYVRVAKALHALAQGATGP